MLWTVTIVCFKMYTIKSTTATWHWFTGFGTEVEVHAVVCCKTAICDGFDRFDVEGSGDVFVWCKARFEGRAVERLLV